MDLMARRYAMMSQVFQSGGHTITIEAGIVTLDTEDTHIRITHDTGKKPFQATVSAIDLPITESESYTGYTYSNGGVGINNNGILSGYRSRRTVSSRAYSTAASSAVTKTTSYVEFTSYSNDEPFKAGVEYVYEIMWID